MEVRKATLSDWVEIESIYNRARAYMQETGNPNQWRTTSPDPNILRMDIAAGQLFLLEDGNLIHGVFALIPGEDSSYRYIDGSWLNNEPYATIHRLASAGKRKGVFAECLRYCSSGHLDLRIDTHHDNRIMRHLLQKHGFHCCGTIYLPNGDPRLAYHLHINKLRTE